LIIINIKNLPEFSQNPLRLRLRKIPDSLGCTIERFLEVVAELDHFF
jgi:hypothetical protein